MRPAARARRAGRRAGASGTGGTAGASGTGGSAGASGTGGTAGASGTGGQSCTSITVGAFIGDNAARVVSAVSPNIGGSDPDVLSVGLYSSTTGSFNLANETDLNTCNQCVLAFEDVTNSGTARYYFQQSGSLTVNSVNSSTPAFSSGTLANVKLIEVTINGTTATPVLNGKCLILNSGSWNVSNTCADGGPEYVTGGTTSCSDCASAEDGSGGCCYAQYNACAGNAECVAIGNCVSTCATGDNTCIQNCGTAHPSGVSNFNDWTDCLVGATANANGACGIACQ